MSGLAAVRPDRVRQLDGVRGIAILLVVFEHLWDGAGPANRRLIPSTTHHSGGGYLGVQLFFVLSGFLITSLLLVEKERHGRISLSRFYERRARRLLPALFLVTGAYAIYATIHIHGALRERAYGSIVRAITYTQDFPTLIPMPTNNWFAHTWSLAIEEQFYLIWPALLMIAFTRGRKAVGIVALASIAVDLLLQFTQQSPERLTMHWDALMAGAVLAVWPMRAPKVVGLAGLGLLLVGTAELPNQGPFWTTVSVVACVLLLMYAPEAGWLNNRVLVYFGVISYGLYLWHPMLLRFGYSPLPTVLVAIVIADLSYRYFERRFLKRRGYQLEVAGGIEGPGGAVPAPALSRGFTAP